MTSTRLPGKVLMKIKGQPVLNYHLDRLQWSGIPIYIATTSHNSDDPIVELAKKEGIKYFRGSKHDVLERYYQCAEKYGLDTIIRVTSDCPLIDGLEIKKALDQYLKLNNEQLYLSNVLNRTYPRGLDFELFSFASLNYAYHHATLPGDREHVTPYINQNRSGKIERKDYLFEKDASSYRITLDTPEDLELITKLIEVYNAHELNTKELIQLLNKHPELTKINAHVEQKKA